MSNQVIKTVMAKLTRDDLEKLLIEIDTHELREKILRLYGSMVMYSIDEYLVIEEAKKDENIG